MRLEGVVPNQDATRVILWMGFLAGRSEIKITHTAEFQFKDPQKTVLTSMGLKIPLALDHASVCSVAGAEGRL